MISYGKQTIEEDDIQAVAEVLRSEQITRGPKTGEFEEAFAKYVGAKYAIAVNSGTAALHLALKTLNLKPGDEVITTANTFAATSNAIFYNGATPVFADISIEDYNIAPDSVAEKITEKTKAILPVHFAGNPCCMRSLTRISEKYNIPIIEDACHALSADMGEVRIGGTGSLTCFSFHPVKHITTGEGGMITTNDLYTANNLLAYRNHGRVGVEQECLGFNYRMSDISAALGLSQLAKAERFRTRRRLIAWKYAEAFEDNESVITPFWSYHSSWHLYILLIKNGKRDKLKKYLEEKGILTQIHYKPVTDHPFYQRCGYSSYDLPVTRFYSNHCLSLPIYPTLTDEEQDYVIKMVRRGLNEI
jgi:perosamine synthetase